MFLLQGLLLGLFCMPVAPEGTQAPLDNEYALELIEIDAAYGRLGDSPEIADLVRIDGEIRALLPSIDKIEENVVGPFYFRPEYEDLGLSKNFWSGTLEYDGSLLKRAHAIDPNSPYRDRTLFSAIEIDYVRNRLPGIETAHRYTLEFPQGPFIDEVYEILATFYDDLYKCLRCKVKPIEEDPCHSHLECYEAFFNSQSFESQMVQAQALAVLFYENALALLVETSEKAISLRAQRDAVRDGTTRDFHWCSPD